MNGDMPHVPITTLAGIASLTDLLNQLPLPSPLPATTTKSLLYNGRIAEEVSCLLSRRDDTLVSQLAHSLNQVSTEHIELKDNLGSDDPEGDVPLLLQTVLSRNPNIFREKSTPTRYGVQGGLMQQPMIPPYKMPPNSMHGSPAPNYQQTTITPSPPSRYVQPQAGSGTRYIPQQNSPVPSPYAPQSPAGYMQYSHPPSYPQHQQIQQVSVSSPIVPSGMRNIHDNKVSGQVSGNSNHNARHCSNDEYISIVQRLGNEESDPALRNASFSVRSVCSPAESEGTPKVGSRPPLILQSPPPYTSPRDAAPDLLLDSPERKKKQKKLMKEEGGKGAMYDIVSSPTKDSTKLTIKLSRVKSSETEQSAEPLSALEHGSDAENELSCNSLPYHRNPQERLSAGQCLSGEQSAYQQVPVLQNTGALAAKQPGVVSGTPYDEAELDALAEIERIERESAIERERCSKEVQDKDKPLKKRKQDSGAAGAAGASGTPGVGGGCNAGNKLVPQEACAASNGASRPALMVSIDLQQAGRVEGPVDSCPVPATEAQRWPEESSESTGVLRLKLKTEGEVQKTLDGRPEVIKQRVETTPQKTASDGRPETPKHKHENRRDISNKVSSEKRSDLSKHRHDGKPDKVRPEGKGHETSRKHEGRLESTREGKEERHRDRDSESSKVRRPDTSKSNRVEHNRDRDQEKDLDKEQEKDGDKEWEKDRDKEVEKDQDKVLEKDRDKDREKVRNKVREKDRNKELEKDRNKELEKDRNKELEKDRNKELEKDRNKELEKDRTKELEKDRTKELEKDRDKDLEKDRDKEREKDRDKEREKDRDKEREKDRDKEREKDRDKEREKDRDKEREKDRDKEREKVRDKVREKDRDKVRVKDRDKVRVKDRDKVREKDRDKVRDKDRDKVRVKDRDREREKDQDKERVKDRDREREKDQDKELEKDRDKEREKDRERVRDRDQDQEKKSTEHRDKRSPEQRSRPDSPRVKQEPRMGAESRSKPERSVHKTSNNKDEKRNGDNKNRLDGHKPPSSDSKTAEFPNYLLGGKSGALKNFVIPKLKRDKDGNIMQEVRRELFSEPCVKLEKLDLVEDLNKGVKPVVVLKKLSIDEVQKLISNSRSSKSSKSKSSYGKSFGEMDSRMPLCERVKMNKRRRSATNEKPKYAEVSSDDDSSSVELAPKRSKKDRDRTWECEEKDRRGSGEHRRSAGHHDSRRGSGSRYRECSPVDSEEDSPPPSLSDLARKLKKEKQKKRKSYEPKLTQDEMMDSSTFKRFSTSVDNILENLEDVDLTSLDDDEIPQELLLGKHQLTELSSESAKIKAMGIMHKIPSDKMVKVQSILEKNIQDGAKLSTLMNHGNDRDDEERLWRDLIMERVTKSADACLTALNVMTSARMPKAVYIEDVIERVVQYTKFHLQNTLYPQYDPVYRVNPHGGGTLSSKAKRAKCSTHKQRVTIMLYNKVCDVISNLSELLEIQLLTDTTILQISSLGITPFFVENVSELQLCAIKLVTAVFSRYEKHRQLILEEIFTSLARLPTSKRNLRNFRLNSSDVDGEPMYIQMVTALVLQLIQCVVHLPSDKDSDDDNDRKVDQDVLITNSYETAMRTAQNFLSVFLKKCGSKQGEDDYRPLFENFVQDLLSTVNKPDWPAAELLLSLLGRLLVHQFSNKQTEMALRVASLDYLGTVAARLRKDAVTSKMDQRSINRILGESSGSDEIQQLQKALLNYLNENVETDPSLLFARKFYIAQWYRDTSTETEKAMKSQSHRDDDSSDGPHHARDVETTGEILQKAEARKKFLRSVIKTTASKFSSLRVNSDTVDYEDSCLIVRYLASMRPFAQSFDIYLTQILRVLGESAIAVRTKAMKCLSEVVAVDPSILARSDMQRGVHGRLMDNSTSVREAAVELLGRFVLSRPQLTEQYYDMLIERILDTGISVRKRVIKILRDICLEQPTFNKITEMCVKMIRRVNDEEGIKKLVNETFQKLWFTPTPNHDKEAMTRKILNITDVVAACRDSGYDWFEQLLQNLLKSEEDASYKPARKACVQLVDSLVDHILKYEESLADCENKGLTSNCLVACITTLYLFSKIRPQLMVKHAMTMQPYLTTKCNSQSDFMVICNVAKILELVVPLMDHPSENFLTTMEEDLMKLIIKYGMTVVQHCVSCLGAVVNKVTHNFKFVWSCFNRYYGALNKLKLQHQDDSNSTVLASNKPALLRSLFTVGALCRHFDFDQEEFKGSNKVVIKDKVLELLLYFTKNDDEEVQTKAIIGLGFLFIQHPDLMFALEVKNLYNLLLADRKTSVNLKIQVLKNLQTYLQEEDSRMQEADREWKKLSKQEDLKEMGDISSGMSSSIMQLYLKQVLESFFHTQSSVRHFALNVIALTLNQGLIHPVQCVPYLIAMGTDLEPTMRNKSDQQLVEIDKKYTGFIHMKAVAGMKMSYQVQQAIVGSKDTVIRGFRLDETNAALCSHLYTMVRGNRQHRRAFLISLLNLFDDNAKSDVNMLLFIADNLACFPYQSQEEPLFIMHHVDITLSVSGSNLLQSFKESLLKEPRPREKKEKKKKRGKKYGSEEEDESSRESSSDSSDDDVIRRPKKPKRAAAVNSDSDSDLDLEDVDKVMLRLPDNPNPLLDFANASQGILLLLMLKQHLKNLYGFSDSKILKYSPTESAKVYDKAVNRKANVHFNPRQTLDYLTNSLSNADLTYDVKRRVVRQYLDFKVLMEHLDPDEEEEEGEASAHARNKAITSLLGGSSPKNNAADSYDDDSDADEKAPGSSRKSRRGGDSAEASGHMNSTVNAKDVIAICCPKYKDRPQIARVIQKTSTGYSIRWMAGSYSGTWAEAKKRDGRKLVPWVDTIKESDIIYKKIALTSAHKLTNKVVQTLRSLYAAKEGTSS
ncbi:nipped-B-like protein B isoform X1 [Rhinichthys klamathensis goyatoka]|uniref:nipped-B-like protein B isoform X1 n=1 Tax=Rhinichthys klamathensis goyatoka TaxID=3034132 RepID=UPI0024B4B24F|nr:nipped-B-like protein B isoform X1 [Rhinichthys klamathensis goyatoka]